jgi:hypothetical protein
MTDTILMAVVSLIGTLTGTFGGILTAGKLTNYRIKQLEDTVREHNGYARRLPVLEEQMKVANHRIEDLEQYHKN